jgi:hypothetical protein
LSGGGGGGAIVVVGGGRFSDRGGKLELEKESDPVLMYAKGEAGTEISLLVHWLEGGVTF